MTEGTDDRRVAIVDAFTSRPLTGNPAGVVPDADDLGDDQMRAIATELGASETAFVHSPDGQSARQIRYFTSEQEVELCGHATVGAHVALYNWGDIDPGSSTIETDVGPLSVRVTDEGQVWLEQDTASVRQVDLEYEQVASALGVDPASLKDVGADLPLACASTGVPFLIVPINFLEHVGNATPTDAAIAEVADSVGAAGIYAFTFDTVSAESMLHARVFAPELGIPEDPVTGTGAGAVAAYLREFGGIDVSGTIQVEQGHFLDRPGTVAVRVGEPIEVGGEGVMTVEGTIDVPVSTTDDIIEV